ncbi:MAG: hypothetical protein Q4A81_05625 [Pasteurellaceae bacterium]|nr:hypothetical protein [Pasteurellaceae bacterium]
MKKYFAFLIVLFPCLAFANPVFTFGAKSDYKMLGVWLKDGTHYKKQDGHYYCWELTGLPKNKENKIKLEITSPAPATYRFNGMNSYNKVNHEFNLVGTLSNGMIDNCWMFENEDPVGTYTLTVTANGVKYPTQTFTLSE